MTEVQVQAGNGVPRRFSWYASEKVTTVLRHTSQPVLYARVRLSQAHDPAVARPASARAEIDLNGRLVCVHSHAGTPQEAIDRMQQRLRTRIEHLTRN
jgi:ribosome-associated translation inhibitor RaiA